MMNLILIFLHVLLRYAFSKGEERCPLSEESWLDEKSRYKCDNRTNEFYHCMRDENDEVKRKCMKSVWVTSGHCPFLKSGTIGYSTCNPTLGNCPSVAYMSHDLYKFSACLYKGKTKTKDHTRGEEGKDNTGTLVAIIIPCLVVLVLVFIAVVIKRRGLCARNGGQRETREPSVHSPTESNAEDSLDGGVGGANEPLVPAQSSSTGEEGQNEPFIVHAELNGEESRNESSKGADEESKDKSTCEFIASSASGAENAVQRSATEQLISDRCHGVQGGANASEGSTARDNEVQGGANKSLTSDGPTDKDNEVQGSANEPLMSEGSSASSHEVQRGANGPLPCEGSTARGAGKEVQWSANERLTGGLSARGQGVQGGSNESLKSEGPTAKGNEVRGSTNDPPMSEGSNAGNHEVQRGVNEPLTSEGSTARGAEKVQRSANERLSGGLSDRGQGVQGCSNESLISEGPAANGNEVRGSANDPPMSEGSNAGNHEVQRGVNEPLTSEGSTARGQMSDTEERKTPNARTFWKQLETKLN